MKTNNSIRNSIFSLITSCVMIITNFIAQTFFIKLLGSEYLGLNGLFTNIISLLSIVELGIGSAIIYNLYKPLSENDHEKTTALIKFYKKAYYLIALIIFIFGLILLPFLKFFINEITININIYLVFLLFIIDTVATYLMSYKRSILIADQKNYIINIIHIIILIVLNTIQIMILYYSKNYYLYLIIRIIFHIIENIIITIIANKKYPYIKDKAQPLDKNIEKDIFKKVKALLFHKIGGFVISGTDNIIISKYLGLITVGLYSNYCMIITAVNSLFTQFISSITSSVGHLLIENNKEKNFKVFTNLRFINFWISTFAATSIVVIMNSFITLWLGKEYLLSNIVLFIITFNFFQTLMRNTYIVFKEAAGIYHEDRFVPIIESLLNIISSIILVKLIGLPGVFIGTAISSLVLWFYSYPKYVYHNLFDRKYKKYFKETFIYLILFILINSFTYFISYTLPINSVIIKFIINCLLCITIPNIMIIILFHKTEEYKYIVNLIKSKIIQPKKHTI